ncbi:MAG: class I SAM-dependent methyltransferase [bacterium]|nr:class I SAM-dependent methyltransferase [bacterium]
MPIKINRIILWLLVLVAIFIAVWFLIGELATLVLLFLVVFFSLILQVRLHNRTIKLNEKLNRKYFRQIEALFSIHSLVEFSAPLPVTREWAVSPDFIAVLITLIKKNRPQLIVELGSGVSTIVCAYILKSAGQGTIISLDHDEKFADLTRNNLSIHGLEDFSDVLHAPLGALTLNGRNFSWYDLDALAEIGEIDMLIVDGPPHTESPMDRYPALPLLFDRLSHKAVIVLDDADRSDERKVLEQWSQEHPELDMEFLPLEKGACVIRK